jgi:hypothetical protein
LSPSVLLASSASASGVPGSGGGGGGGAEPVHYFIVRNVNAKHAYKRILRTIGKSGAKSVSRDRYRVS